MSESKSIILTGASRGIGLAVAKYLLAEKHNVFLVARTKGPMEELKKEFPDQVEYLSADLADFEVRVDFCYFLFGFGAKFAFMYPSSLKWGLIIDVLFLDIQSCKGLQSFQFFPIYVLILRLCRRWAGF